MTKFEGVFVDEGEHFAAIDYDAYSGETQIALRSARSASSAQALDLLQLTHKPKAQTTITDLTDTEAAALFGEGDISQAAGKIAMSELVALLGAELAEKILAVDGLLSPQLRLIAGRVALEQGLDPMQCIKDLEEALARTQTDAKYAGDVRALGQRMGAPQGGNRKQRRTAAAQARRK
jgi:hypothetical protein